MGKPGILSFIHTRDLSPREKKMLGEKLRARRTQLRQMLVLVNRVLGNLPKSPARRKKATRRKARRKRKL
jgi:hypothetical protein